MASQAFTYLLWLFGGWAGIHHVYLGRLYQALAYFFTFGGGFGIAWLRDLYRIPAYVSWTNGDKEFQKRHMHRMAAKPKPSCGVFRSTGMVVLGTVISSVLCGLLPTLSAEPSNSWYHVAYGCTTSLLSIVGSTIGITAVKVWNRSLLTTIVIAGVLTIAKQRFKEDFIEWDVSSIDDAFLASKRRAAGGCILSPVII
ncbi:DnaJ-like protein subfamily C member 22 [Elysia marginata]|uniref:DnaJ-like protein subfamily C member 22 n=1 Tax=Elysia marginata TaxID=1093978 RepID=A0AAV4I4X0_9GAST|nr:DnaJ-like protein subfamily C member 22 [Elysia marginata]